MASFKQGSTCSAKWPAHETFHHVLEGMNENTRSVNGKPEAEKVSTSQKGISIHDYTLAMTMHQKQTLVSISTKVPDYITDTDDGSVSSLESLTDAMDRSENDTARNIFHEFWQEDKKRYECRKRLSDNTVDVASSSLPKGHSSCITKGSQEWSHPDFTGELKRPNRRNSCNIYEEVLMMNEAGRTVIPSAGLLKHSEVGPVRPRCLSTGCAPQQPRRTIFTQKYSSVQSPISSYGYQINTNHESHNLPHSTSLGSVVQNKRYLKPSLRGRSVSYDSSTLVGSSVQSSQSKLSVSFDPNVSIHEFNKPYENYVAAGWSKLFA